MPFQATVLRALISSPSDTTEERRALRTAVEDWSSLNGEAGRIVILPLMWERDSHPEVGRPQAVVNRQLGDRADLVIATFWTRIGTETDDAESGSVEEIERALSDGRPVLLYFSSVPAALENLDQDQFARLQAFRERMKAEALIDSYRNTEELVRKVTTALTRVVRERFHAELSQATPVPARAQIVAKIDRETRVRRSGSESRNYFLVIENVGTAAAEDVSFNVIVPEGQDADRLPEVHDADKAVRRLMPGNPLRYLLLIVMGTLPQFDVKVRWREGDQQHEETQTLRW